MVMVLKHNLYIPYVILVLFLILSFVVIKPFVLAILFGALLAYVFHFFYRWLVAKLKNKTVSALLVCILVFLLFVVPSIFFVQTLVKEAYALYVLGKAQLSSGLFEQCHHSFCVSLREFAQIPEVNFQIQTALQEATTFVVTKGTSFLLQLPRFLINLFIVFFTMFYFLRDGEQFLHRLNYYLHMGQEKYSLVLQRLKEITHGLVYGYLLVALIQGAVGTLGFLLFGVPSPFFWGMVMALLALIPYLGTGFVWVPATIFLFLEGMVQDSQWLMIKGVGLFVYGLIIISGIDNILKPRLMGGRANIHPVIIILGIFGGLLFFGPLGVFVGPLLLSLTTVFIDIYVLKKHA